jgi:hypothetical protein
MFTSRCITPRVRVDPTLTELDVRRSSAARFSFSGTLRSRIDASVTPSSQSERTTDHMMQRTLTRIDSPRHTGACRSAASWRAPIGATGAGAYAFAIGLGESKRQMRGQWGTRQVGQTMGMEAKSGRTSMSGDRPLDADGSGAGSRRSEGTP